MLVLALAFLVGLSESAGVASVMPFIAVLSNPRVIDTNRYMAAAYALFGFNSRDRFLLVLGVAVFVVLIGSLLLKALGLWAQLRYAQQRSHSWARRLVAAYLGQPYEWFLDHHSGDLGANVLAQVDQVVNGALTPALQAAASAFVAAWLFAFLLLVDPVLSLCATVLIGGLYGVVGLAARKGLARVGVRWKNVVRARFRLLQEMLGGIKDVKVMGLEDVYFQRFATEDRAFIETKITSGLIRQLPSLAMQAILFGGILLTVLYLMGTHGNFEAALPTLTVFAFAGYRLMPALQTVYQSSSEMRFSEPALDSLSEDVKSLAHGHVPAIPDVAPASGGLLIEESVELRHVQYAYPGAPRPALDRIVLRIPARQTIGLVGSTGSGKTTAADVLLGLLRPQVGAVVLDGRVIEDSLLRRWQQSVGYVPQQIFLADDTIEANIAFGVSPKEIDKAAVARAARAAGIHDFIAKDLPQAYATTVGERGVRLSGGQRQRIGIARALYRDPQLLILDEATSSLDNVTEQAVMDAVHHLEGAKTIVLVAHRLSTVRECDCIYMLAKGRVTASGSYDELVVRSPEFRALAELA